MNEDFQSSKKHDIHKKINNFFSECRNFFQASRWYDLSERLLDICRVLFAHDTALFQMCTSVGLHVPSRRVVVALFMAALWKGQGIIFLPCGFFYLLLLFFFA